jgi:hypothetical protein
VGAAEFDGLFRVQSGVNSAEDNIGAAVTGHSSDLVTAKHVRGMDAYANRVAGPNAVRIKLDESLIHDRGVSITLRGRSGENVEPTRSNDGSSEGHIAWVYKVNLHGRMTCFPKMS